MKLPLADGSDEKLAFGIATPDVLAFADLAASHGWSAATLQIFCDRNHISAEEQRRRWPRGVRSLAHEFNANADARTLAACDPLSPPPLSAVLLRRFRDNEPHKRAVLSLARSDLLHPLDTLRRTAQSAGVFWRCQDAPLPRSRGGRDLKSALLVLLYSAAVLVWLCDRPSDYGRLRKAIRFIASVLGAR